MKVFVLELSYNDFYVIVEYKYICEWINNVV